MGLTWGALTKKNAEEKRKRAQAALKDKRNFKQLCELNAASEEDEEREDLSAREVIYLFVKEQYRRCTAAQLAVIMLRTRASVVDLQRLLKNKILAKEAKILLLKRSTDRFWFCLHQLAK